MAPPKIEILPPDRRKHLEAVADLQGKCFAQFGGYYAMRDDYRLVATREAYDWRTSRIGLLGEQLVTHFGVMDYTMRVGSARLRVAGIRAVATNGDHRKKGYMADTTDAALAAMVPAGYDVSILFGIHDFYHRFGYVRAWNKSTCSVPTDALPTAPDPPRTRVFRRPDREDLAALYNRQFADCTGTAVHPFWRRKWVPARTGYLWRDARGRAAGYVIVGQKDRTLTCFEFAGGVEAVLSALAALARRRRATEVAFAGMPPTCRMARHLRRGTCTVATRYARSGEAMIRTVNLGQALGKMRTELARRLKRSPMAGWRGRLRIADARQQAVLAIGPDGVRIEPPSQSPHLLRGGDPVARLLIGAEAPEEILDAGRIRCRGDAARLAAALFPNQHPALSAQDDF